MKLFRPADLLHNPRGGFVYALHMRSPYAYARLVLLLPKSDELSENLPAGGVLCYTAPIHFV